MSLHSSKVSEMQNNSPSWVAESATLPVAFAIVDLPRTMRRLLIYLGEERPHIEEGIEVWP